MLTKEEIKRFKESEKEAQDFFDFLRVSDDLVEAGDTSWAKKVYKKAEAVAEESREFCILANSLNKNLDDNKWVIKVLH